jgi:CPA2 family monovalent cation:H+ antiporter-2
MSGQRAAGLKNHVIIAGYGLNGRNLARVLKETGIPYAILELNPDAVREAAREGEPILFGDISSPEILRAAGLDRARVIVFVISDPGATRCGVRIARQRNRDVSIIVRTRYVSEIDELYSLGANQVIPEEFETSIEIFTRTLAEFHVPRNVIDTQGHMIRSERYGMLRGRPKGPRPMEKLSALLTAGTAETFLVSEGCPASGKTLRDLDLRGQTGATVIAVVRGEQPFISPSPDFRIEEDDILVLVANHRDMDRAFRFLEPCRAEPEVRS